jgi:hypothetical protein
VPVSYAVNVVITHVAMSASGRADGFLRDAGQIDRHTKKRGCVQLLSPTTTMIIDAPGPQLPHPLLATTFEGVEHPLSTLDTRIHQFRGIKYASVPARFRQSKPFTSYGPVTDASRHGSVSSGAYQHELTDARRPICPQQNYKSLEEDMFELSPDASPTQSFKQSEFECLNLNITCPAGLNHDSRVPVMIWIHGQVSTLQRVN